MSKHDDDDKGVIPANDQQPGTPPKNFQVDKDRALIVRETDMIPAPTTDSQIPVEKLVLGVASAVVGGLIVRRLMRK